MGILKSIKTGLSNVAKSVVLKKKVDSIGTFKSNGKDVPYRNDRQRLNQY